MKKSEPLGVIIVSYASSDVIEECLSSLISSSHDNLKIVVCDNASPDGSRESVRVFAASNRLEFQELSPSDLVTGADVSPANLTLISAPENMGYAGAINLALDFFLSVPGMDLFWILNPDSVVQADTASAYVACAQTAGEFSLMSGRTLYFGEEGMIQSDGGTVNLWTGICRNRNFGLNTREVDMPAVAELDYLSGANIVASRKFVEQAGKMCEDYFLYYEEVDWAMRRGDLPLLICPEATIFHHGGTSIGSGTTRRRHSPFSNYFNYRNRLVFVRRFRPRAYPVAYVYSVLKVLSLLLKGAGSEANSAWKGMNNRPAPGSVMNRLDENAQRHAFKLLHR